jgi:uncharacterized protein YraI
MRTKYLAAGLLAMSMIAGTGAAEAQQTAFTSRTTNLRAGPAADYPIVAVLPSGFAVSVQGCLADYDWCDVVAGVQRGWMYAGNISYHYQNTYVPLAEYAPLIGIGVLGFALNDYWGSHYRDRSWYRDRHNWQNRHVYPRGDRRDPRFVPHRPGAIMPPPPEPYQPRIGRHVPDGSTPIPRSVTPRHQRVPDGSPPPPRVDRGERGDRGPRIDRGQRGPVPDGSTPLNPAHQFN